MSTVAAGIKALLSGVRTAGGIIKKVESSEALQARFDESSAQVNLENGQVPYAVCKALVAHALGRDPSDDDVSDFLSAAVGDPAFPARAHRLMGEARKAASHRRRAFLTSILFGLPFSKMPDDERDRVDMAVERMIPEDADLLQKGLRRPGEPDTHFHRFSRILIGDVQGLRAASGEGFSSGDDERFADRRIDRSLFQRLSLSCGQSRACRARLTRMRGHRPKQDELWKVASSSSSNHGARRPGR